MSRKILVTTRFFDPAAYAALEEAGFDVRRSGLPDWLGDEALDANQIRHLLVGIDGWILGSSPVDRRLLVDFPQLRILARRGVGYDAIDVGAARELGRLVVIAAGGNEATVADHTLGLMLAVLRRIGEMDRDMRAGATRILPGSELTGKAVGLIGFGRIGRAVARRLSGFDVQTLVVDPVLTADNAKASGVTATTLDCLLAQSDVVSLHLPSVSDFMMDAAKFARMKKSAVFINTARAGLVDEAALALALEDGLLAGAGLDVRGSEADPAATDLSERIIRLPNVVSTPHAAASSQEGARRANQICVENIVDAFRGHALPAHRVVVDGRINGADAANSRSKNARL